MSDTDPNYAPKQLFTYRGARNNYLFLIQDAEFLIELARRDPSTDRAICLSRSAIRSLCHAPEALVNLVIMHFGEGSLFDWFDTGDNEKRLNVTNKYANLHRLCGLADSQEIKMNEEPFVALGEINRIRNAFSHPKGNFPIWLSHDCFFNSKDTPEEVLSGFSKRRPDDTFPITRIPCDFAKTNVENADALILIIKSIESAIVSMFNDKALVKGIRDWPNNEALHFHSVRDEEESGMVDKEFFRNLEKHLDESFERLGCDHIKGSQDNSFVRQLAYKMNERRTFCYILYKDKTGKHRGINLVFRFRSKSNPVTWFKNGQVSQLAKDWSRQFKRVWSEETKTPDRLKEAARVTEQFGIGLCSDDFGLEEFGNTLDLYVRIACEAARQGNTRTRNWQEYESMIE